MLKRLMRTGMNVARINLSHGTLKQHREDIRRIRSLSRELNSTVTILADLPGPKIRVGKLNDEPIELRKGSLVTLATKGASDNPSVIPVDFKRLPESVSRGSKIYLNDGFIQLRVKGVEDQDVICKVIIGGKLLSHKGLNLPGAELDVDAVTEKDLDLMDFCLGEDIDAVSVSFAKSAADILKVKNFAASKGKSIYAVAKIERKEAVDNIDEILKVADAVMVARGDLGVEIPIEKVPLVQKMLISKANIMGRPVITATQMLESMTANIRPTRAEVTDVANAILDGTDAVMLSEETAIGDYPVETLRMMVRIAAATERHRRQLGRRVTLQDHIQGTKANRKVEDVIAASLIEALNMLDVRLILTPSHSGTTPRLVSRFKPVCWVLAFSDSIEVCNFLALSYGVHPVFMEERSDILNKAIRFIKNKKLVKRGDQVLLTEGLLPGRVGGTDTVRIITVD